MVMMFVPAGQFSMGSPDGIGKSDEQPQHTVFLDAFWVDRTDVTNAMYAVCVKAGGCTLPHSTESPTRSDYYGNAQYANYPVINVDWNQAAAYCGWVGQASGVKVGLPSEAQWEKAARGTDGRAYPWGNGSPDKSLLNYNGQVGDTSAVGSYPSGASPYGALDMAGNVWEWVNDWYDATYYANSPASNPQGPSSGSARVVRGGAWTGSEDLVRSASRLTHDPVLGNSLFGFRCARSQ
jgi:formylglycine-generating enzyme required for sulfatase activity